MNRAYAHCHAAAARLQARHPGVVAWYGETSGRWYAMDAAGLHDHATLDGLTLLLWWRAHRPRPRGAHAAPL
ncbi:MAG: hypothetical protein M0026_21475 [Nocardiopsaceae bacterium]|nr:hypothetical protein [Nocardiopsaceae bacterium]